MSRYGYLECARCGKMAMKPLSQITNGARFCGVVCSNRAINKAAFKTPPRVKNPERYLADCIVCGQVFSKRSPGERIRTCSRACGVRSWKREPGRPRPGRRVRVSRQCRQCGAEFIVRPCQKKQHCSSECTRKTNSENARKRLAGLNQKWDAGTNWKGDAAGRAAMHYRARKLLAPDSCAMCGGHGDIVHHKDENPWNNDPTNLQRLCRACHINHHRDDLLAGKRKRATREASRD